MQRFSFQAFRWLHFLWQRFRILLHFPAFEPILSVLDERYVFQETAWEKSYAECKQRGWLAEESLTYGETDWTTFLKIVKHLQLSDFDVFVELGCGTGQFCFFVNRSYNIPAVGIDRIPAFIEISRQIARQFQCRYLSFLAQDFLHFDFLQGTVYFVSCPYFTEPILEQLAHKLALAPTNARIVSVSKPLVAGFLVLESSFPGRFSWGRDTVWIYRKTAQGVKMDIVPKETEQCLKPKP